MNKLRSAILKLAGLLKPMTATPAPLLKLAGIVLLSAVGAFGQGVPVPLQPVIGSNGQPRAGATISVCAHPANAVPCTNYYNVYNDIALTQLVNQATNPLRTDGLGNPPAVYANPSIVDYTISGTGITTPNGPYVINIPIAAGGNTSFASVTSTSANPAGSGFIRMASGDTVCWENTANNAVLCLSKNAADQIVLSAFAGVVLPSAGWSVNTANLVTFSVTNPAAPRTYTVPDFGANDSFLGLAATQSPLNKTIDISLNTLEAATVSNGHYPRTGGTRQYVDSAIPSVDLPATTSNCTGNNFAQGLNAGGTPACAASSGGVSQATWTASYLPGGMSVSNGASPCTSGLITSNCIKTLFAQAHTVVRVTGDLLISPAGCTTQPVVGIKDLTSGTAIGSITVSNGQSANTMLDTGAISVSTTAGDTFGLGVLTAPAGCTT